MITTALDGDDFNEAMGAVSGIMDEEMTGGMDFSDVVMNVTIRIYKDTKLPASISMKMDEDSPMSVEQEGTEVSIGEMSYEIRNLEYDAAGSIEIPEEAKNAQEISAQSGE